MFPTNNKPIYWTGEGWYNPDKTEDIAKAMTSILEPQTSALLSQKGLERAKDFSWDKTATELWSVLESI